MLAHEVSASNGFLGQVAVGLPHHLDRFLQVLARFLERGALGVLPNRAPPRERVHVGTKSASRLLDIEIFADLLREEVDDLTMPRNGR